MKNKNFLIKVGFIAVLALTVAGCGKAKLDVEDVGGLTQGYRSEEYGVLLDYPEVWKGSENAAGVLVKFVPNEESFSSLTTPSISVAAMDLEKEEDKQKSVDFFVETGLETAKGAFEDFNLEKNEPTQVAGKDGREVMYTGSFAGKALKVWEKRVKVGDVVYSLTYNAPADMFDQYAKVAEGVMNSFQIEE